MSSTLLDSRSALAAPPRLRALPIGLAGMPWWSSPAGLALGFLLPVIFLIAVAGGAHHPGVTVRGLIFLDGPMLAIAAAMILVLGIGGWWGSQLRLRPVAGATSDMRGWDAAALVIGVIALAAYCLWFKDYVFNPVLLWQTLTGAHRPGRENITLTPGLTSLTNFAPAFFAIFWYRLLQRPRAQPMTAGLKGVGIAMVAFTLFRVYAWSERLALIEAAAPLMLIASLRLLGGGRAVVVPKPDLNRARAAASRTRTSASGVMRRLLSVLGPYAAIPLVVLLFGAFEFFRSWETDTYKGKLDFWDFAIGRFITYYYTSLNNGAGLLSLSDGPSYDFGYTLEWLHRVPFHLGNILSGVFGRPSLDMDAFLFLYGDPEFNSPSGVYAILLDMGYVLGIGYVFVMGVVAGVLFVLYRHGRLWGVMAYPMMLVAYLEIFRYPYLGQPRAFTAFLGMLLAVLIVSLSRSSLPRPRTAS